MVTKGLAAVGIAAACLGGVCLFSDSGVEESVNLISIKVANEYKEAGDKNKFGGKYSYYFLSTKDVRNKNTWNEKAIELNKKKGSLSSNSFFKNNGADLTGDLLKNKCEEQYKQTTFTNSNTEWKEVWEYCSFVGQKPTTINEANNNGEKSYLTDSTKFGGKLKTSVISVSDEKNTNFWALRDEAFRNGDLDENPSSTFFNKEDGSKDLKKFCSEAYKAAASSTNPNETEVKKYCSLN